MNTDEHQHTGVEDEGLLGDLEDLTRELLNIWGGGSETRWWAYMWSILEEAGLVAYEEWDEVGRTVVVSRLLVLAGINREFAARAWSSGHPGQWRESVALADLIGEYPRLDAVAIGRLAERAGVVADPDPSDGARESATDLVCEIADSEWSAVVKVLTTELGQTRLFASLWMTRDSGARYPLPERIVDDIVNSPNEEQQNAFSWVSDGCDPRA